MKENIKTLTPLEIEILKKDFETHTFQNDFDLVYENQIPCAGIAVIEGKVVITKSGKNHVEVTSGHILGVHEVLDEVPVKNGCRVKAGSKIILLGRSDLLKFRDRKKSNSHPLNKLIKTG